jgi:hypothetical protein
MQIPVAKTNARASLALAEAREEWEDRRNFSMQPVTVTKAGLLRLPAAGYRDSGIGT